MVAWTIKRWKELEGVRREVLTPLFLNNDGCSIRIVDCSIANFSVD